MVCGSTPPPPAAAAAAPLLDPPLGPPSSPGPPAAAADMQNSPEPRRAAPTAGMIHESIARAPRTGTGLPSRPPVGSGLWLRIVGGPRAAKFVLAEALGLVLAQALELARRGVTVRSYLD